MDYNKNYFGALGNTDDFEDKEVSDLFPLFSKSEEKDPLNRLMQ